MYQVYMENLVVCVGFPYQNGLYMTQILRQVLIWSHYEVSCLQSSLSSAIVMKY